MQGHCVFVHCTDGWDRTAQLASLARILIEKRFRTIDGFIELMQREWVSFGFQFGLRLGQHANSKHLPSDRSPVFTQFIDCVWQIMSQYPDEFEFNGSFLIELLDKVHSGLYLETRANSELERHQLRNFFEHRFPNMVPRSLWRDLKKNAQSTSQSLLNKSFDACRGTDVLDVKVFRLRL